MKRGETNIAARAILLAVAYVVATGGLLAVLLLQLRNEALGAARKELAAFAQLTAGHTFEVMLGVEEALQLAAMTISLATDSGAADEESIGAMLRSVARNSRVLQDIVVLDLDGRVVFQADARGDDIGKDRSTEAHLSMFENDPMLKFHVGAALHEPSGSRGDWPVPMVHVWRRGNGDFAGVIVGLMNPRYFDKAWTFDAEIDGLAIALATTDGTVIMRRPFVGAAMGRPLVDPNAHELPILDIGGTLMAQSAIDGSEKLFAYRRIAAYPDLAIFVSQPMNKVLAGWWRIAVVIGCSWLVASLALGALGAWLARTIRARGVLESRYRALFDSIPHPVIVSDEASSRVLAYNDAAARQYGWAIDRTAVPDIRLPADFALLAGRRSQLSADAATVIEGQRHRNGAGALIDVDLTARLIEVDDQPALLTIAVDVTARMQAERARQAAEDQLRQSQKMEVLGQLTGGIAHDFNNILMVIEGNVEALLERGDVEPEALRQLAQISDQAERAEELTRRMLAFSRKLPLRPRPTNVNDLVVDTGKLLRRTLGEHIEIDSVLSDDLWRVDIDRAQFETSLVNLCLNARDAMPNGGRVLIETQNVHLDERRGVGGLAGDCVLITVSDTGSGIAPEHIERVFEPFFTTKGTGKNSGLGLSMVYGLVRQSKGHIDLASEVGRGTTVRIYLPRCAEAAAAAVGPAPAPIVGGRERVLVVEDDEQVRSSVVRQLRSLGYTVDQAADGVAGLAAFEGAQPTYDLLLSDVIMPGALNGKELADEVIRRWPRTRIVFMSGYTDNALGDRQVLLLSKPFRKSDLARMMRLALDGEAASTAA